MRSLEFHYLFKYPFETVVRAYFQKYSCGKDKNVTSVAILECTRDANSGEEYYLRRGKCVNVLPSIFRKFWPYDIEIEEEMWINHDKQYMRLHSYNVTGASLAKLEEFSIYAPSQYNRSWTVMDQTGKVTVCGLGPTLGGMLELFTIRFFQHGADRGFKIMEDLLMSMTTTYEQKPSFSRSYSCNEETS
ncbi:PRELI domain-containing protein 2 [Nematostella vectensis]|uniref:PRELI domain-containing protein 2 n=1 Tax=Nematostella vectensis TaxID=45351 RepID=UPI002077806B|nr:PRELI domain-containing protein 2 [Nematostella vectensis]